MLLDRSLGDHNASKASRPPMRTSATEYQGRAWRAPIANPLTLMEAIRVARNGMLVTIGKGQA